MSRCARCEETDRRIRREFLTYTAALEHERTFYPVPPLEAIERTNAAFAAWQATLRRPVPPRDPLWIRLLARIGKGRL